MQAAVPLHRGQSEHSATAAGPHCQQGFSDLLNDTSSKRSFANRGDIVEVQGHSLLPPTYLLSVEPSVHYTNVAPGQPDSEEVITSTKTAIKH